MERPVYPLHVFWPLVFIGVLVLADSVLGFNVDTKSPLVFTGPPNSYFGYSVAILQNSQGTWLLVGAPRANDSSLAGVHQPGAVFQCNWQYRSSCQPIFIDHIGNEKQVIPKAWRNITVTHHKDNQWLGAAIDVNVNGDREIMICAPRWIENRYVVQGLSFMNGLCYESDKELHFTESSAWPALAYWKKQIHKKGFYAYGMGSLGMSATYSQNGKFSVLGTPGLNDWSGGFAFVDGTKEIKPRVMSVPTEQHNNSYFGMSIATARLSKDDVFTIIGGPKSDPSGKIMAYNKKFQLLFVKEGEQYGSSFGSSVCAVDLNADGLDDLVVGAPLYSDVMDEGRVYVYINREFFNLELITPVLSGSNAKGARFGTSVANVGDLNSDGCEDIAVGAPYEEVSGVVYIYNGAKSGLHFKPSQRIVGRELNSGLKTFGWSFSRPWDVDSNHYKDFAVGSFESNKVVLLRTRSVLDLYADLDVTPSLLNTNDRTTCTYRGKPWHCLEVKICLRYTGLNLPPSAEVNITLKLDTLERHQGERSRLFARREQDGREVESVNQLVTVRLGRLSCYQRYKIYVRPSRDVLTPLKLELEYNIASDSIGIASLCTICPIRNIYNPSVVHAMSQFVSGCGEDNECHSDLSILARPAFGNSKDMFIIDDDPSFDLKVSVSNQQETSYFTVVTLEYSAFVHFASVRMEIGQNDVRCMQSADSGAGKNSSLTIISCELQYPLGIGTQVSFSVKFYAHGIPYEVHEFDIAATVTTASNELLDVSHDNTVIVTIPVFMESKLELTGVSIPSQVAVIPNSELELPALSMSHFYILRNLGPSPIPHAQLTLSIPQFEGLQVGVVNVETISMTDSSHVPVECSEKIITVDHSSSLFDQSASEKPTSFVTCSSSNCSHIRCYVGLMNKYEAVYINVSLAVQQDVLDTWKVSNQLGFMSTGWLEEPDYSSYYSLHFTHNATIGSLIVYAWHPSTDVPWWILFISIVSGLFLLYIITVILWKCGFFTRKKKEELQMLIATTEAEREILNTDSLSASSSDIMVLPSSDNSLMFTSTMIPHNNNNDSIDRVGGHFNEGHNVATLHRRNYHFEDVPSINDDHSSYTHPRHMRPPFLEQNVSPHRLESFQSLPRPQGVRAYNQQQYYLEPPPAREYHRDHHHNHHNYTNGRHDELRIAPPPPTRRLASPQAFNNEMYLEPVESRG